MNLCGVSRHFFITHLHVFMGKSEVNANAFPQSHSTSFLRKSFTASKVHCFADTRYQQAPEIYCLLVFASLGLVLSVHPTTSGLL